MLSELERFCSKGSLGAPQIDLSRPFSAGPNRLDLKLAGRRDQSIKKPLPNFQPLRAVAQRAAPEQHFENKPERAYQRAQRGALRETKAKKEARILSCKRMHKRQRRVPKEERRGRMQKDGEREREREREKGR